MNLAKSMPQATSPFLRVARFIFDVPVGVIHMTLFTEDLLPLASFQWSKLPLKSGPDECPGLGQGRTRLPYFFFSAENKIMRFSLFSPTRYFRSLPLLSF